MAPVSAPPRIVVSAPAPSATADPTRLAAGSSATAQLDRASDLYERGRYAAALAEAKAVLGREPGNREARSLVEDIEADMAVAARLKQAQDAMRRGDREEALAQVRAGLAVKNNDGRLLALFKELTQ
jgi:type II secretory pathway component HofQ